MRFRWRLRPHPGPCERVPSDRCPSRHWPPSLRPHCRVVSQRGPLPGVPRAVGRFSRRPDSGRTPAFPLGRRPPRPRDPGQAFPPRRHRFETRAAWDRGDARPRLPALLPGRPLRPRPGADPAPARPAAPRPPPRGPGRAEPPVPPLGRPLAARGRRRATRRLGVRGLSSRERRPSAGEPQTQTPRDRSAGKMPRPPGSMSFANDGRSKSGDLRERSPRGNPSPLGDRERPPPSPQTPRARRGTKPGSVESKLTFLELRAHKITLHRCRETEPPSAKQKVRALVARKPASSVRSGRCAEMPQAGWRVRVSVGFSQRWRLGSPGQGASLGEFCGEDPLPGAESALLVASSRAGRSWGSLRLFLRALVPFTRAPTWCPEHLPKARLQHYHLQGLGFQHEFAGTQTFRP